VDTINMARRRVFTLFFIDANQTEVVKNVISRDLKTINDYAVKMWKEQSFLLLRLHQITILPDGIKVAMFSVRNIPAQDKLGKVCMEYRFARTQDDEDQVNAAYIS
jgi:hypothetical protein